MTFPQRDQFGGDLARHHAREDLADEKKHKMLCDNRVRFYLFSEGGISAARKAKMN